jgi:hypothetical protein
VFAGFATLETPFKTLVPVRDPSEVPVNVDVSTTGTYQVFGPDGAMTNGSGTLSKLGATVGLYQAAPTPRAADGYEVGTAYRILCSVTVGGVVRSIEQSFIVA